MARGQPRVQVPGSVDAGLNWYRANVVPKAPKGCLAVSCWKQGLSSPFDLIANTSVAAPVGVSWGMRDTAFDNEVQLKFIQSSGLVPNLKTIMRYPNNTHWLAEEQPAKVAADLDAFLGSL